MAITAKARTLGLSVSELMRRGATAYESPAAEEELATLADQTAEAALRASSYIDDALAFIDASNQRMRSNGPDLPASFFLLMPTTTMFCYA